MPAIRAHGFAGALSRAAADAGRMDAIVQATGDSITYKRLEVLTSKLASWFRVQGIGLGDPVVVVAPNSAVTALAFFACLSWGYRFAPVPCTATAVEIQEVVECTGARVVFLGAAAPALDLALGAAIKVVRFESDTTFQWLDAVDPRSGDQADGKLLIGTSGSSGNSKMVVIDGARLWAAACDFVEVHAHIKGLIFWNYLPMSYLGGLFNLLLIPFAARGTSFISEAASGSTLLTFWQTIEQFRIEAIWFTPSIARGVLELRRDHESPHVSCLKAAFIGTAPVTLEEKNHLSRTLGLTVLESYGLTETTFITMETLSNVGKRINRSVGGVLSEVALDMRPLRDGERAEGDSSELREVWVKTPYIMDGYMSSGGALTLPLDEQGYFCTGDVGYLEDGQLVLTGRTREIIKRGGLLISLPDIEERIRQSGLVRDVVALPVSHRFYGESYWLVIIPLDEPEKCRTAVRGWCQKNFSRHKWPEDIQIRDSLPRTSTGKIRKEFLTLQFLSPLGIADEY